MSDMNPPESDTRFVLVPVPSEFVLEVMRWVLFRAPQGENMLGPDEARLLTLMGEVGELERKVLERLAEAALQADTLRLIDLADELDSEPARVRSVITELNVTTLGGGRDLIGVQNEKVVGVRGNVGNMVYLSMRAEHARMVKKALRQADAGTP